jgi:hypothetical protein
MLAVWRYHFDYKKIFWYNYGGKKKLSMDDLLRQQCKELKIYQGVKYSEIADYLEIKKNSFYNWLKGQYTFSQER